MQPHRRQCFCREFSRLCSSDDGGQMEDIPVGVCCSVGIACSWRNIFESGGQRAPEGWNYATFDVGAPFWSTYILDSCWDAATHKCSTSVSWHCFTSQDIIGSDGQPRTRDILGSACSGLQSQRVKVTSQLPASQSLSQSVSHSILESRLCGTHD
jgi:hypothetical protein